MPTYQSLSELLEAIKTLASGQIAEVVVQGGVQTWPFVRAMDLQC